MATYSIIGAGNSGSNPVTVFMGCGDSVNICWTGRKTVDAYCSECYYIDSQYCEKITGVSTSTTGTIPWEGNLVHYKIIKNCEPAPTPQTCTSGCSDFSLYTVPTYVPFDYDDYIDIYYKYTITCEGTDGYIVEKEELSGMESIPFSSFTFESTAYTYNFAPLSRYPEVCSGTAKVFILSDEDSCVSGTTVDVTTIFTPSVVPALPSSGTDVTISVKCKKIEVDEDCNRKITNSGDTLTWHVRCFSNCCSDHIVSSAFTMNYIKRLAGVAENEDATIKYNGVKVPSSSRTIPYSITQKAKYTEECSGSSDDKTTKYCVDASSIKVEYEKVYLSNEWSEDGIISFGGGRIKVSWNYSACTDTVCTPNTWEEIIEISSCDDRYSGEDAECTYSDRDSEGKVTGSCVIYFKEQTDNCGTCPGENPYDPTSPIGKYNKINYTFVQNCDSECQEYTHVTYDKQAITVDKCYTGTASATVPYTSTTEYIGELCPSSVTRTGSVVASTNITSVNNSNTTRTVFEDDKIIVIQNAGPCDSDTLCEMSLVITSGLEGTDTALIEFTDTDGTVEYNVRNNEEVQYYSENGVTASVNSDPDNTSGYVFKFAGQSSYIINPFNLGCGDSRSIIAVKGCTEEWGTGTARKDNVPAAGGIYTLTSTNIPHTSVTCTEDTVTGTYTITIPANTSTTPKTYTDTVDANPHGRITYIVNQLGTEPVECNCDSFVFEGTEEPDPPQEFLINVSIKNSTSSNIRFVALNMVYTDSVSDAINLSGGGLEIAVGQTKTQNDNRLQDEHEGKTISFIAVVYYQGDNNVQRSLDNDEWWCTTGKQLGQGDTLFIEIKR